MKRSLAVVLAMAMLVEFMFLGPVLAQPQIPDVDAVPEPGGEAIEDVLPDVLPAGTMMPATFHHEDFSSTDPLSAWDEHRFFDDEPGASLWQVQPFGREGDPAATLAEVVGDDVALPSGLHQALISPTVDLTGVPAVTPDGQAERPIRTGERGADIAVEQADATLEETEAPSGFEVEDLPRSPARLVVDHAYAFPDDRDDEEDETLTGFTIEARAPGSSWVPLEPAPGMQTARPLTSLLPLSDMFNDELFSFRMGGVDVSPINDASPVNTPDVPGITSIGGQEIGETVVAIQQGCLVTEHEQRTLTDGMLPVFIPGFTLEEDVRQSVCVDPAFFGEEAGVATPQQANAQVDPLDARGYTGTSDRTGDGEADFIRHSFDLSSWAGSEVEIRFRAGTSNFDEPDAFWSIDDVRVESVSQAANMRLDLAAPAENHLGPPGEAFPIQVEVQNVGQLEQKGPFEIDVQIDGPLETVQETVTINASLGFLESATGQTTFTPTARQGYDIAASLESTHLDADPRDDEAHAPLLVGVDETMRLTIHKSKAVLEDGSLLQGTVSVENRGNVPVDGSVDVRLHPYDPLSAGPTGEGTPLVAQPVPVSLAPNERMHPLGVESPTADVPFEGAVAGGSYLIVARLGDAIGTAPVGVDAPPPPVFEESFEDLSPGSTSFELDTATGTWEVRGESDVRDGLVFAPFQRDSDGASTMGLSKLEPGALDEKGAWVPSAHESLVLTPTDRDRLAHAWTTGMEERDQNAFAEAPRSPVSVSALTHQVDLEGVETAQLDYLSALSIPPDQMGITEVQVLVQPRVSEQQPLLDDLLSISGHYAEQAADAGDTVSQRRCLGDVLEDASDEAPVDEEVPERERLEGLCLKVGNGLTDPCEIGIEADGQGLVEDPGAASCFASLPRWDALAPLAGGDLVHQAIQPHAWEPSRIDLSDYAGSIVDVSFVFISEADEAEIRAQRGENEDNPNNVEEASYATPQRLRSMLLLDQVRVMTDQGQRLDPAERSMADPPEHGAAYTLQPGAEDGWRSLGYAYMTGLGGSENPLRSQAQVLEGPGRPAASGAQPGSALTVGTEDGGDQGIRLFNNDQTVSTDDVEDAPHPAAQPAVTMLASPSIDLGGLQEPQLSFDQRFSLHVGDEGDQRITEELEADEVLTAFDLPDGACGIEGTVRFLISELRCAFGQARERDPSFDVSAGSLDEVMEPRVPAGMFMQVSEKTPDGWSDPVPVAPVDGYRYPVGDPGGFQPTLEYDVEWNDTAQARYSSSFGGGDGLGRSISSPVDGRIVTPRFSGEPVWAGDTDITGDGIPDWATTTVDLSPWAGEEVKLEFVLTARVAEKVPEGVPGAPWAIDNLVIGEAQAPGRITLDELAWPSEELPLLDSEHPLPIRVSAGTPTGLDAPVHMMAALEDATGCVQATVSDQTRYLDDSGRPAPMPPGESVTSEMLIGPESIQGPPPWRLHVAADSGRTPSIPMTASVDLVATTSMPRTADAYDVDQGGLFEARIASPTCEPQPEARLIQHHPDGVFVQPPSLPTHRDGDVAFLVDDAVLAGPAGAEDPPEESVGALPKGMAALVVTEAKGSHAGIDTVLLRTSDDSVPVHVETATERLTPGTPLEVTVRPSKTITSSKVELVPIEGGDRVSENLGSLSPLEPRDAHLTPTAEGPHIVTVVGKTSTGAPAMGISSVLAMEAPPVTDPVLEQRTTSITVSEGTLTGLRIPTARVDPFSGLSTEGRTVSAVVENPGTTELEGVEVTFRAEGTSIGSESVGTLLPGEKRSVSTVYTPLSGSTTLNVKATAHDGFEASRTIAVQALQDLGALSPDPQETSEGWRLEEDRALFQDDDTTAPRDTVGTLPLKGPPLASLADFSLLLQHDMDMEEGFDGGQALIQETKGDAPRLGSDDLLQAMSPFSPIQDQALTGTLAETTEFSAQTGPLFESDDDLSLLLEEDAMGMLEEVWRQAGDPDELSTGLPLDEETCQGVEHPDEERELVDQGAWCEWVEPKTPYPSHRSDVWLLHVGPFLPDDRVIGTGDDKFSFRSGAVTQYLFLETDDLVGAAQTEGALTVTFDEARILGGNQATDKASIEMCAHFIAYEDVGGERVEERQERRCSGLEHGERVNLHRDWGESTLRIPEVPSGSFDVMRLEFSLRNANWNTDIDDSFRGWFIGPVTAKAGQADVTWSPDDTIYETDPTDRTEDVIEQSGLLRVTGTLGGGIGGVGGDPVDSAAGEAGTLTLSQAFPLIPWAPGHENTWIDFLETSGTLEARLAAVPYQLGLACEHPGPGVDTDDDPVPCDLMDGPGLGMGPQVLGTNGPEHPLLERARDLHLQADAEEGTLEFKPYDRGYNLDYRLIVPIDLKDAAARATAQLDLTKTAGDTVTLALRSQGTDVWQDMDVCHIAGECSSSWKQDAGPARVDLSDFVGETVELGIRVQNTDNAGKIEVRSLVVEGGLLSMLEGSLALKAWTDTSVEGQGWIIDDMRLFGRTLGANVGLHAYDSPLAVEDANVLEGDRTKKRIHVHADFEGDAWTSPLRLQTFNQGPDTRTVDLQATFMKADSDDFDEWHPLPDCSITLEPGEIELAPFETEWHEVTLTLDDMDRWDDDDSCGEIDLGTENQNHYRLVKALIQLEPHDLVEEEATRDDDVLEVPLLLDPWGVEGEADVSFPGHERGVQASEIEVSPTRPEPEGTVQIGAWMRNIDTEDAFFNAEMKLYNASDEPDEEPRVRQGASDATPRITTLEPYAELERPVTWTYHVFDEWEGATLVEIEIGEVTRHAWMHVPELHGQGPTFTENSCGAPQVAGDEVLRRSCTLSPDSFEHLSPPLIGVRALWQTPDPSEDGYAGSGWTLQACFEGPDSEEEDPCPNSEDPQEERLEQWVTLHAVHAPEGTVATVNPDACPVEQSEGEEDDWGDCSEEGPTTTARETWANVAGGSDYEKGQRVDVIAGTSPGAAAGLQETVLFSLTSCSLAGVWEADDCPIWETMDRFDTVHLRLVTFHDAESDMNVNLGNDPLNPDDGVVAGGPSCCVVTPVAPAPSQTPALSGLSYIPEAEAKAVTFAVENKGSIGTDIQIDASLSEDARTSGWTLTTEGLTESTYVEPDEEKGGRVLVESPISPTGTTLRTTLQTFITPTELEDVATSTFLPVQTQPGKHPNLVAQQVRTPNEITVGEEVTVEVNIRNDGQSTSTPVPLTGVARYEDGSADAFDTTPEFEHVPSLPPGGQALAVLKWVPSQYGDATVRVGTDLDQLGPIAGPLVLPWGEGDLRELQECAREACPNVAEQRVNVEPPSVVDLMVDLTLQEETPLIAGEPVDIDLTVTNHGPADAPRFEARLLAGVVSLLEDDPLVVDETLKPGETWSTSTTLIPPRSGDLRLTASAFSDESIVQEARRVRSDGTLSIADNTLTRTVPVIARGLDAQTPSIVEAEGLFDDGSIPVGLNVTNRGSTPVQATIAALGDGVVGTLVDANGTLTPRVEIPAGESLDGTLELTFDEPPNAGRHPVDIEVTSDQGSAHVTLQIEVPNRKAWAVHTTHARVDASTVPLQVPVTNQGNTNLTLRIGQDAPGLTASPVEVSLEPGETQDVTLDAHVTGPPQDGIVWARTDGPGGEKQAPLYVETAHGPLPSLLSATARGGEAPTLEIDAINAGMNPTMPLLTVAQGNETVEETRIVLDPGEAETFQVPIRGEPGAYTIHLKDGALTSTAHVTTEDLRPRVLVEGLRISPPSPHAGDHVEVRATLTNHGDWAADVTPALFVDGEMHRTLSEPVHVTPEAPETVRFTWEAKAGERALAVSTDPLNPDVVDPERGMVSTAVNVTSGFFTQGARLDGSAQNLVPAPGLALLFASTIWIALIARRREHH